MRISESRPASSPGEMTLESFRGQRQRLAKIKRRDETLYRWLAAVLLAILLEGAARKWILPRSMAPVAYFAKDLVAVLFLLTVRPTRLPRWAHELERYVLGIGICLTFSFFDGLFQFPVGAVVTLKNAVLWPLFAVRMATVMKTAIATRLWRSLVVASIGIAILSAVQYLSPSDSLLNRYAWEADKWDLGAATAGDFVRATGTFSFIAGLSTFSLVLFSLSIGRLVSVQGTKELVTASIGLGSAVLCGLTSGSRSVEASMAAILLITFLFVSKEQTGKLLLMLCSLCVVVVPLWTSSFGSGALERWNGTGDGEFQSRALGSDLGQPIDQSLLQHPLGIGLGLYSGFSNYTGNQDQLDLPYNEDIHGRIATEAGVPAFAALTLTVLLIVRAAIWMWKRDIHVRAKAIPFCAGILIAATVCLWYDHTSTGLWWWATGLLLGECMGSDRPSPKAQCFRFAEIHERFTGKPRTN